MDGPVTIEEAANRLGLHYMTVYRYVRIGRLPAVYRKGRWHIDPLALEGLKSRPGRRRDDGRTDSVGRLLDRLIAGDASGAWSIVEAQLMTAPTASVYLGLIAPALRRLGEGWAGGTYSVADEHRATAVAIGLVGRLGPLFSRSGRKRPGPVMLAGAEGDAHSLPLTMVADMLRADGFDVIHLGADVPVESLAEAVGAVADLRWLGISASTDRSLRAVKRATVMLRKTSPGLPVIVGGPAVTSEQVARRLGADGWAEDGLGVVEWAARVPARRLAGRNPAR